MKNKNFVFIILGILAGLNILAWITVYDLSKPQLLEVTSFDVGQGDSIFIKTPQRHQILIDGGPSSAILEKLGKEMPFYDRTIDLIILTHPEADHLSGLLSVLKRYKIKSILWTGVIRETAEFEEWQKLIKEEEKEGAKIIIAKSGQKLLCSQKKQRAGLCEIDILSPVEDFEGKVVKDSNNTSVVAKLTFGQNSFLFTGDIYQSLEKDLITQKANELGADILKIAHHASKTSSSEEFLTAVSPETAIISLGLNNSYGHPNPEVLERLAEYGIKIFRTDLNGDIKIIADENNYAIPNL